MTNYIELCEKAFKYMQKRRKTTPIKVGQFLGFGYYEASSRGHQVLKRLMESGKINKNVYGEYFIIK